MEDDDQRLRDGEQEYLEYLRHPPSVLNNTELDEQAGQAVLVVLLTRLGVIPGQLLELESQQHNLMFVSSNQD